MPATRGETQQKLRKSCEIKGESIAVRVESSSWKRPERERERAATVRISGKK